jgi:pseudouridine-5'-phosphate glycosidase
MLNKFIKIREEIKNALKNNKPVVALESTLISHGLPFPENLKVAKKSIQIIKNEGAIAATIAVLKGKITIGLSNKELEILANQNNNIEKISIHNLPLILATKKSGATTVSSSIMIAEKVGIKYFSTGGIGGVHIEADKTFDISSDLLSLSKAFILVVCSGPKTILDLSKTFEMMETLGISCIGYKTNYMPGFWYHKTNKKLHYSAKNINEICKFYNTKKNFHEKGSLLVFNPIPINKSLSKSNIDKWIKESIKISNRKKIKGKDITPFLIKSINKNSSGKSLQANIDLILNNAKLAAKIAVKNN